MVSSQPSLKIKTYKIKKTHATINCLLNDKYKRLKCLVVRLGE